MIAVLQNIDMGVLQMLYALRLAPLNDFFLLVTHVGDAVSILAITALVMIWLCLDKKYADAFGLATALVSSTAAILAIKYAVNRLRPDAVYQLYAEGPFHSFPSAHAGLTMALYGYCVYLFIQTYWTPTRRVLAVILPLIIFLVGFSRLYLGVHYLSDVLVGYTIGAASILLAKHARISVLERFY